MSLILTLPHGKPVFEALSLVIRDAKTEDALAPVTVVVPSNYAALSLRRELARQGSVVNVRFLVFARLAELLGAPGMPAGQRPLSPWRKSEALRYALIRHRGSFEGVARHPATERALDSTFRDLRLAPDGALDQLRTLSRRSADLVDLFRDYESILAGTYEVEDLARSAAAAVRAESAALGDIGKVIFFLPRPFSVAQAELAKALGDRGAAFITAVTFDTTADANHLDVIAGLGARVDPERYDSEIARGTDILRAIDQEEEVRAVTREIVARAEAGTPLHRMAILFPNAEDYAPLVSEVLTAAGIAHNGPPITRLLDSLAGRFLARILNLEAKEYGRDSVMEWLTAAPVIEAVEGEFAGQIAPAAMWDECARDAGVVRGLDQWRLRLAALPTASRVSDASIEHARRLGLFIEDLASQLRPPRQQSLAALAEWADSLLERYLGSVEAAETWAPQETAAYGEIRTLLRSLVDEPPIIDRHTGRPVEILADLSPAAAVEQFAALLARQLDRSIGRLGVFGNGVFAGPLSVVRGMHFDHVFILGMVDGILPPSGREDPLLPDLERVDAGLPEQANRRAAWREDYLVALAAADRVTLCFAQSSLRSQSKQMPSRWLLETAGHLAGRRVTSEEFSRLPASEWLRDVLSFEHAIAGDIPVASDQEWELRSMYRAGDPHEHFLGAGPLRASLEASRVRMPAFVRRSPLRSDELSVYAGGVGPGYQFDGGRVYSPTSLENLAECGFRYFLDTVIRVKETARPENIDRISALDRGTLIHDVLETFLRDRARAEMLPGPGELWTPADRDRMAQIVAAECDRAEARGITGSAILWKVDRARIIRDAMLFLDSDNGVRAKSGATFLHAEQAFGARDESSWPAVEIAIGDGQTVRFGGRIDRIDQAPDGSLRIYDYKTGSAGGHRSLEYDPSLLGSPKFLQLPIYGRAVRQELGREGGSLAAYYWFASERSEFQLLGGELADEVDARLEDTLGVLVRMAERGMFPAVPGTGSRFHPQSRETFTNCKWCDYDRVCEGGNRLRAWNERKGAAGIAEYITLVEGGSGQDEVASDA